MLKELKKAVHVSGLKQTSRAVRDGKAKRVYIARDASFMLVQPLRALCEEQGIPVEEVRTMRELGAACGLQVGAAAVAEIG